MNPFGYNLNSRCRNKRFSNRPVSDAFGYNERSEVIFSRRVAEDAEYSYNEIGNLVACSSASITNHYIANNLNQYATICASVLKLSFFWGQSSFFDIKNMAYFYIYPAFDKIVEKGNLK